MKIATLILLVLTTWSTLSAQIVVDGQFDDWTQDTVIVDDSAGDGSGIDFRRLMLSSDEDDLFIRLETESTFGLQEDNDLTLYIDTDNDPGTGTSIHGIGADLVWKLGQRKGTFNEQNLQHADIGLVTAPTVTSDIFEWQISRQEMYLFTAGKVKVLLVENGTTGDHIPDNGALTHELRDISYGYSPVDLNKSDTGHLRVMNYNVLFNGLTDQERIPRFSRIMNAIQPDVIAFNELFDTDASEVKDCLDTHLPLDNGHGWYTKKVDYGNVTASRYPITKTWEVYPGRRISAFLIDLPAHFPQDLLAINAHLKCCNADETRQDEVDAIAEFYGDIQSPGGDIELPEETPFILLGDLNLVGDRQHLETLISGDIINEAKYGEDVKPDWDNSMLTDLLSYHSDAREAYTWWDPGSSFYPGRLDFMIYTESVLNVEKHYLLRTESMRSERLQDYGLQQDDTREASDHLPKVADFSFKTSTGSRSHQPNGKPFKVYPVPAYQQLTIQLHQVPQAASMALFATNGQPLMQSAISSHRQAIDMKGYPSGLYNLRIRMAGEIYWEKIIKQRIGH